MIIFDVFFLVIYNFCNRTLRRCKDDAKHSALCFLTLYIPFSINTVAYIIGLFKHNEISWLLVEKGFESDIVIGIVSYIVFRIRYYRIYDVEDIEQKVIAMSKKARTGLIYVTYFILVFVPIGGFIFYRLYKFGHI